MPAQMGLFFDILIGVASACSFPNCLCCPPEALYPVVSFSPTNLVSCKNPFLAIVVALTTPSALARVIF